MTKALFSELYDLFAQYKLKEGRDFASISDRNKQALSGRIALYFKDHLQQIVNLITESQGIIFRFDNYNPKWENLGKVSRKAVFYSDVSIVLLTGEIQVRGPAGASEQRRKTPKKILATNMDGLVSTLLRIKPLVERGIVIPLPGEMVFDRRQEYLDARVISEYNAIIDSIKTDQIKNVVVPVSLDKWAVRSQIEEMMVRSQRSSMLRPLHIYLPHLSNVPLDTLISIREDNYDSFMRFQQAMRGFLITSSGVKSERAFIELASKVDYEVGELRIKMEKMKREATTKSFEAVGGLIASSLTLLVNADIARFISIAIGSKTIFDGLKFVLERPDAYSIIKDSKYYLAYKVQQLSESGRNPLSIIA